MKFNAKVDPNLYTEEYFLDSSYAGSDNYKKGCRDLPISINIIYEKIPFAKKNHNFLDLGCGKGELLYFASKKKYNLFGVDYSPHAVKLTKNLLKSNKLKSEIVEADVRDLPYGNNEFDIITSTDLIEHLDNDDAALIFINEAYRTLKKGGKFYLHTSPNSFYVDFFKKYYQRYADYLFLSFINLFSKKKYPVSLKLRHEYEIKFHINEQNYFKLKKVFNRSNFENVSIKVFSDPLKFSFFKLPYYVFVHLYPLNKIPFFNYFLGNHFYVEAKK